MDNIIIYAICGAIFVIALIFFFKSNPRNDKKSNFRDASQNLLTDNQIVESVEKSLRIRVTELWKELEVMDPEARDYITMEALESCYKGENYRDDFIYTAEALKMSFPKLIYNPLLGISFFRSMANYGIKRKFWTEDEGREFFINSNAVNNVINKVQNYAP